MAVLHFRFVGEAMILKVAGDLYHLGVLFRTEKQNLQTLNRYGISTIQESTG